MTETHTKILNFILFQICWVASVWGAARGWPWLGPACVVGFLGIELFVQRAPAAIVKTVAVAGVLGFAVDSIYTQTGLIRYASAGPWPQWAPVWIVAMWAGFALTLHSSLEYLSDHPVIAASLGLIGGPLAYWIAIYVWDAGTILGEAWVTLAVIAIAWAIVTPLLFRIARFFELPRKTA